MIGRKGGTRYGYEFTRVYFSSFFFERKKKLNYGRKIPKPWNKEAVWVGYDQCLMKRKILAYGQLPKNSSSYDERVWSML